MVFLLLFQINKYMCPLKKNGYMTYTYLKVMFHGPFKYANVVIQYHDMCLLFRLS